MEIDETPPKFTKIKPKTSGKESFSGVLKSMNQGEVNGPLLLQAFEAALLVLKTTEDPDEKSCIILEHYGALECN
ncbi:hypothetical protein CDAR_590421 [Caerostris darwini]|uniref:Uncharacterized protein n=1 Tax=Caerostris darwini TaxID=1538125 RepID=A0AAV4NPY7_9ARAC|nr:hypothetical protein CDAR_590421 [Caerostris darwini]